VSMSIVGFVALVADAAPASAVTAPSMTITTQTVGLGGQLVGVACPSSTSCEAVGVGYYPNPTGPVVSTPRSPSRAQPR
jgi:hypothetical protein